jgi:hypothetical protein
LYIDNKNTSPATNGEGKNTWGVMIPQVRKERGITGLKEAKENNNILL